jgi:hypothetical protein
MATSERRRQQRSAKKAKKKAAMAVPGGESVYARKKRGDFPLNSPYRTGVWQTRPLTSSPGEEETT